MVPPWAERTTPSGPRFGLVYGPEGTDPVAHGETMGKRSDGRVVLRADDVGQHVRPLGYHGERGEWAVLGERFGDGLLHARGGFDGALF